MGFYDENHCHDFYLKEGKIGILLGVEEAEGDYIIWNLADKDSQGKNNKP